MQRLRGHTRLWARSSRLTEAAVKKLFDGVAERLRALVDERDDVALVLISS